MINWKNKNNKYIKEGELYLSFDFLETWNSELLELNHKKEGARYLYPDSLIRFLNVLKVVFGIGFRQEQGFLQGLNKYVFMPAIISYSQIQRRTTQLGLDIIDSLANPKEGQIIAIDSSGIKLYNSGEWIREKHKKKKPFLKLHIAVNTQTKQAVAIELTEDSVGDCKLALKLVDKARKIKRVTKGLLDGAYDTYNIWNGLNARAIKPLIRLRKNAVVNKNSKVRSQAIKVYKNNKKEWVKATGFGQRWQSETWFSSYKRRFGEHCYSTKPENVLHEILFKACLCNKLIV
jgi:hypothetical protein